MSFYYAAVNVSRHALPRRFQDEWSALHWASDKGHEAIVWALLKSGAYVDALASKVRPQRLRAALTVASPRFNRCRRGAAAGTAAWRRLAHPSLGISRQNCGKNRRLPPRPDGRRCIWRQ